MGKAGNVMLDVIDLNLEFHDHLVPETVVYHFNLHMEEGDIIGLVGESGSGKSMTALAIAGLLRRHDMKKQDRFCSGEQICSPVPEISSALFREMISGLCSRSP